eukprot:TRINITY_DN25906_c0_g1_i1.p1 TRINITY_DN25906_c0_g1~~TRINITY_DN25906_c0_g1_i1.p1  ORF type:complete len:596 (+),score=67.42 TRINITY_DN25906_c0_g1_i1:55-1842(+)
MFPNLAMKACRRPSCAVGRRLSASQQTAIALRAPLWQADAIPASPWASASARGFARSGRFSANRGSDSNSFGGAVGSNACPYQDMDLPPQSFDDLPTLSEDTRSALRENFKYYELSEVQQRVLPIALSQRGSKSDLMVRAHTGTGKTLAFLIPAVEAMVKNQPEGKGVATVVIAPTRELAIQIGQEAEKLLEHHGVGVVVLTGGVTKVKGDQVVIRKVKPRLIVATPGRLLLHFERTFLFPTLFEGCETLILDEADRLLDLGFVEEVKEIVAYLPPQRRTMLFSATIPQNVTDVATRICRGRYIKVDCVGDDQVATTTMLDQSYAVFPGHQLLGALYNLLMGEMERDRFGYKVLVFFPTARLTAFMAQFFREQLRLAVYEIHRRREPEARLAAQDKFRFDQSGIMFSSDVSARGMDYPNVTLVIQFCAPASREMYIHRVGRTARAGTEGRGVLLLGELERDFLKVVEDLPLKPYGDSENGKDPLLRVNELLVQATRSWLTSASLRTSASAAFASMLMHYKATHRVLHMVDDDVIQAASDVLLGCGLVDQPVVTKRFAVMLGLEKHPQLQCASPLGEEEAEGQTDLSPNRRASWRG